MSFTRCALCALAFAVLASDAWCVELVCPPEEKVTLVATSPGWHDNSYYPRFGLRLAFEGMRVDQEMVVCRYTVESTKIVSFRRYAKCLVAKGTWQEQGVVRLCQATRPQECSLECLPAQESK